MLEPLINKYQAIGSSSNINEKISILETIKFNAKELGDDTDIVDVQSFFSEAGTFRTTSGEAFVSIGEGGESIIFLRRYGFYNDGGNFFVPFVNEVGGKTENMIVLHDDLKVALGKIELEQGVATYNGNRAILSIHNNLNALKVSNNIQEKENKLIEIFATAIGESVGNTAKVININETKSILQDSFWSVIVSLKNTADSAQFKSSFIKNANLKSSIETLKRAIGDEVMPLLDEIDTLKKSIQDAEDKKAASQAYRRVREEMIENNKKLKLYFALEELVSDLSNKKSKVLSSIFELVASEVDLRVLDGTFSRIGIGTGYDDWVKAGKENGFPPLPEGIDPSDFGNFPHFVLSKKDESVFDESFLGQIMSALNDLIRK